MFIDLENLTFLSWYYGINKKYLKLILINYLWQNFLHAAAALKEEANIVIEVIWHIGKSNTYRHYTVNKQ